MGSNSSNSVDSNEDMRRQNIICIIYLSSGKLVTSFLVDAVAGVPHSPSLAVRIHRHGEITGSTHQEPLRCAQKPKFFYYEKWVFDAFIRSGSEPGRKALQTQQDS